MEKATVFLVPTSTLTLLSQQLHSKELCDDYEVFSFLVLFAFILQSLVVKLYTNNKNVHLVLHLSN